MLGGVVLLRSMMIRERSLAEPLVEVRMHVRCVINPASTDSAKQVRLHTGKQLKCKNATQMRNAEPSQGSAVQSCVRYSSLYFTQAVVTCTCALLAGHYQHV